VKRFETSLGYVEVYEPYQPEGEPLWQRGVSRLYINNAFVFEVPTTDEGSQALADIVETLYQEHMAASRAYLMKKHETALRNLARGDKEVQNCDASKESTGPEETEVGIREEGSEASRDRTDTF
jgi:hypothetical protein